MASLFILSIFMFSQSFWRSATAFATVFRRDGFIRLGRRAHSIGRSSLSASKVGVIIVDHGSKRNSANEMLLQVVDLFQEQIDANGPKSNIIAVEAAHMEMAEPSIAQAYGKCVSQGAEHVVVHPFFLSQGRHVQDDIPQLVQEAAHLYPHVPFTITPPLGSMQKELVELIDLTVTRTVF